MSFSIESEFMLKFIACKWKGVYFFSSLNDISTFKKLISPRTKAFRGFEISFVIVHKNLLDKTKGEQNSAQSLVKSIKVDSLS